VRIPKPEERKPRKVSISVGGNEPAAGSKQNTIDSGETNQ
jgi:hypothetical protein